MKRYTPHDVSTSEKEACRQPQEYNNLLDHYMPQRPTTHKDLHRAAIGSFFTLVYLLLIPGVRAQNAPHTPSEGLSVKVEQNKLVKNEPAKPTAASPAKVAAPTKAAVPATVAAPVAKSGKLREIPLSTLESGKAVGTQASVPADTKPEGKPALKTDSASQGKPVTTKTKKTVTRTLKTVSVLRLNNGLIPPPPPIVPIGMDVLGMYAQPIDYLSIKDLEGRKKELTSRFNELDSTVSDAQRQIRERKERAELFESLYKEGVVSRKELEVARREAEEIERDVKFKLDEFESVKISMKAVNNRLAALKKMEARMNAGKHKDKNAVPASKLKGTEKKK